MSDSRYFFQHFHHLDKIPSMTPLILPQNIIDSPPAQSILLCINVQNFDLIRQCTSFLQIIETFSNSLPPQDITLRHIWPIQHSLLLSPQVRVNELLPHFVKLNLVQILDDKHFKILASLDQLDMSSSAPNILDSQDLESQNAPSRPKESLKVLKEHFTRICTELRPLLLTLESNEQSPLATSLDSILTKFSNQHFSIGITGVMSAGKSTFLNALLGEEILGSSNIPETANLTILRYGTQNKARVHFWSKDQWDELKVCAQSNANLQEFIEQTQNLFGENLKCFITTPSLSKDIESCELHTYTSANHPSRFCNLIQQVELFTPLTFLQNGVEIVDTPGLDDPISKREEITREYLGHCDLLIHIMNASCAATQVDVDFILESLLERNISRLLIVLTRVDLLSPQDIQDSLNYTQNSLITQLKKSKYKGDIQAIIARIDFIPVASYTALLYKTNRAQEAKQSGLSLEQSGILDIESYLKKMLLGEESLKAKDILYLACNATLKITHEASELLELQNSLLRASSQELEQFIASTKAQNDALLTLAKDLRAQLDSMQEEFSKFLHTLSHTAHDTLFKIASILKDKVLEDILYTYSKGTKPESDAIMKMIELSLRDCFADIGREFKYELAKQITHIKHNLQTKEDLPELAPMPPVSFRLTQVQVQELLSQILGSLPKILSSHSLSSKSTLQNKLDKLFENLFGNFEDFIASTIKEIQIIFHDYFNEITSAYTTQIENKINHKQQILNDALAQRANTLQDSQANSQKANMEVQKHIENLCEQLVKIMQSLNQ